MASTLTNPVIGSKVEVYYDGPGWCRGAVKSFTCLFDGETEEVTVTSEDPLRLPVVVASPSSSSRLKSPKKAGASPKKKQNKEDD